MAFVSEGTPTAKVREGMFGHRFGCPEELLPGGGTVLLAGSVVPVQEPGRTNSLLEFSAEEEQSFRGASRDRGPVYLTLGPG